MGREAQKNESLFLRQNLRDLAGCAPTVAAARSELAANAVQMEESFWLLRFLLAELFPH
jgi:hypothetical protein